jgi:hypothetical protein
MTMRRKIGGSENKYSIDQYACINVDGNLQANPHLEYLGGDERIIIK